MLIVEDNPDVTRFITSFLENDYRILTAGNGQEGLTKAVQKYPDLIISDVMMPKMDGFELVQNLKTDERISHIPIILLTAKADLNSRLEGLEFGADDYISKPFEVDELKVRSKNLIDQRRRLREKFIKMTEINVDEIAITPTDEKLLNRLLTVIHNNISNVDFHCEDLAGDVGMSRSSLNRKIRALTNQSALQFIRSVRLKQAAQLLKRPMASVSDVAYAVGFNNPSHFAKIFRQQFSQSPKDFANQYKNNPA